MKLIPPSSDTADPTPPPPPASVAESVTTHIISPVQLQDVLESFRQILSKVFGINEGENMNGHTNRNSQASGRAGSPRRGRPRKIASGETNRRVSGAVVPADGKRGRGRPKGSKNKSTLEREAAERAAKRAARQPAKRVVGAVKPAATKRPVKKAGKAAAGRKKSATANPRKRGGPGGRKGSGTKSRRGAKRT